MVLRCQGLLPMVSSPAPRIRMAGDPWPAPPPRLVNTAPSPVMVRMKPPTFSGLATRKPWSSGASPVAYAAALTQSSQAPPRAALPDDPADRGRGIVPDGFDSPPKRRGTLAGGTPRPWPPPRAQPAPGATAPRRGGPRGARPARLPGPAGGVGCGPRRPAAVGAESPVRPGPRPPALDEAGRPSPHRQPTGVSPRTGALGQRGPRLPGRHARRPRWGRRGRRASPDPRLVPHPAHAHLGRLAGSDDTLHHHIRWR